MNPYREHWHAFEQRKLEGATAKIPHPKATK